MNTNNKHIGAGEFRQGWLVLLGCLVGVTVGASPIPYNTIGFFLPELNREFGWSFGELSVGITIYGFLAALLAPFYGALADRYGSKPVAVLGLAVFGLIFGTFAFTPNNIAVYYGIWVLIGFVSISSTPVIFSRLVNQWFHRRRGLALGIMLLGTSLAAIIIPPLVTQSIEAYGWRKAYLIVACLPLLIGVPVTWLLLREPREEETTLAQQASMKAGVTLREALRDRRFWIIWCSIVLVALAFGGAHIHMPEIVKLHGYSSAQAARVMQVVGLSILSGRLIVGFLLDRFWAPLVCLPVLSVPALSCWMLASGSPSFAMVLVSAFLLGFAAGAESDLVAYLASRYFGLGHYGKIYGMLYMPFVLGSAFSPAIYGMVRDATGGYGPMLHVASSLFVLGAVLLLFLGRYPAHFDTASSDTPAATATANS